MTADSDVSRDMPRTAEWWADKLHNDLAFAAPELWKMHIQRRFQEAIDAAEAPAEPGALSEHARQSASGEHLFDESCRYCVAAEPGALSDDLLEASGGDTERYLALERSQRDLDLYNVGYEAGRRAADEAACPFCGHPEHLADVCEADMGEFGECHCADTRYREAAEPGALRAALELIANEAEASLDDEPRQALAWIAKKARATLSATQDGTPETDFDEPSLLHIRRMHEAASEPRREDS